MAQRGQYSTRQRELVISLLRENPSDFMTVDAACSAIAKTGQRIGRTTVYRTLESLAAEGTVAKVADVRGRAAQYRLLAPEDGQGTPQGQLRCTRCGKIIPLDCHMLGDFTRHVEQEHGFAIDRQRTVFCGLCADCRRGGPRE